MDKNRSLAQVLRETDEHGAGQANYIYGSRLVGVNKSTTGMRYYHFDGQDSVRQLSDSTGIVTDTYAYDAYGNLTHSTNSTGNTYLYTGEQFVPESGFYYLRARHYDPATGRFTTMDLFPGFSSDSSSLHRYIYAENVPVNNQDPSGLFSLATVLITPLISLPIGQVGARPMFFESESIMSLTDVKLTDKAAEQAREAVLKQLVSWEQFYWMAFDRLGIARGALKPIVKKRWEEMANKIYPSSKLERGGNGEGECRPGKSVYVHLAYASLGGGIVYLCPDFFKIALTGLKSSFEESGTRVLIHEYAHLAEADDISINFCNTLRLPVKGAGGPALSQTIPNPDMKCYGLDNAVSLARHAPSKAVENAENYAYAAYLAIWGLP